MNKKKIFSLTENSDFGISIANKTFTESHKQILAEKKIIAGLKGNFFAFRNLLLDLSAEIGFQLDFFDELQLKNKIFDDESFDSVLYFQNFYPNANTSKSFHIHWENYRYDEWVRNRIYYSGINALNLGNEHVSPIFEAAEMLRIKNCLPKPEDKNFTLAFVPNLPESPVSAHSAITAAALLKMNVNICLPELFPLDFDVLSNAEVATAQNQKTFNVKFSMDDEVLENSDIIICSSWAQLGKHFQQQTQLNLLNAQKIGFNLAKLPSEKIVLPALSYPYIKSYEQKLIKKALENLLIDLVD